MTGPGDCPGLLRELLPQREAARGDSVRRWRARSAGPWPRALVGVAAGPPDAAAANLRALGEPAPGPAWPPAAPTLSAPIRAWGAGSEQPIDQERAAGRERAPSRSAAPRSGRPAPPGPGRARAAGAGKTGPWGG